MDTVSVSLVTMALIVVMPVRRVCMARTVHINVSVVIMQPVTQPLGNVSVYLVGEELSVKISVRRDFMAKTVDRFVSVRTEGLVISMMVNVPVQRDG